MRKTVPLLFSSAASLAVVMAMTLVVASGVALAVSKLGTNGPDTLRGTDEPRLLGTEGTTDHFLVVDAEVGAILRVAARLEDREFYIGEVTEIAYDEQFPDVSFRLELPGVEFERG